MSFRCNQVHTPLGVVKGKEKGGGGKGREGMKREGREGKGKRERLSEH